MDPTQQEGQNPDNVGAGRQAIFTPPPPEPTTPDTNSGDANAQPTPSVNLAHPYFSNHPTQTSATETGDIILNSNSPKPKHNKRPFIIGGVILIGFILAVAIILAIISNNQPAPAPVNLQESFTGYLTYLEKGTSDEDFNLWPLLSLADGQSVDIDETDYMQTLEKRYEIFEQAFENAKLDLSDTARTGLKSMIVSYGDMLQTLLAYADWDNILQTLTATYTNDEAAARKMAEDLLPEDEMQSKYAKEISQNLHSYLTIKLDILKIYRDNNCFVDTTIDGTCVANIYPQNSRLQQLDEELTKISRTLDDALPGLITLFKDTTQDLHERIGALNE